MSCIQKWLIAIIQIKIVNCNNAYKSCHLQLFAYKSFHAILRFFASTSTFDNKLRSPLSFRHPTRSTACQCPYAKEIKVNWAKNYQVRAVFLDEVKILEQNPLEQNSDFQRFGIKFNFRDKGPIDLSNFYFILRQRIQQNYYNHYFP